MVALSAGTYQSTLVPVNFTLNGAPSGTTISSVSRDSATQATLTLAFDGTDFDLNASISVTINQSALATGTGPVTTAAVVVAGIIEEGDAIAVIDSTNPASLTESNLNGATVTVTLTTGAYDDPLVPGDFGLSGAPAGTTISSVSRASSTEVTLTLGFNGTDFDADASMSVTVSQNALATGDGLPSTGTTIVQALQSCG